MHHLVPLVLGDGDQLYIYIWQSEPHTGHLTLLQVEAIIRNMAVRREGKTEVEGEHQNNGRTGFFDPWRTLSRPFSAIRDD